MLGRRAGLLWVLSGGIGTVSCGESFGTCEGADCSNEQPSGGSAGASGGAGASSGGDSGTAGSGGGGGVGASGGDSGSGGSGGVTADTCETDGDCDQNNGCNTCGPEKTCQAATVVPAPGDLKQCSVFEDYGVFVRPDTGGSDDNDGSRGQPFKTLAKAVAAVQSQSFVGTPRIYACADVGPYDETLTLDGVSVAVDLYGNVNCEEGTWEYATDARATVAPQTAPAYALRVANSTGTITFEGFHFEAPDAVADGASSIAVFISDSPSVSMARVELTAGEGKDGAVGTQRVSNHFGGELKGKDGGDGGPAVPGGSKTCGCGDDTDTISGRGGRLGSGAHAPDPGEPGSDANDNADINGNACAHGNPGGAGTQGAHGTNAATSGALTANGWAPGSGTAGENGTPGQGGGGGGAKNINGPNLGGGGGGCGGCGGAGADPGQGGGASVALAVFQSGVTLDASCTLAATNAGAGGTGGPGEEGQDPDNLSGGGIGAGDASGKACNGGKGGPGKAGGISGAGAGGISVGIAYIGTRPTGSDDADITFANAAEAGAAVGANGSSPPTGISQKVWEVQ